MWTVKYHDFLLTVFPFCLDCMVVCIGNTSILTAFSWEMPVSVPLRPKKNFQYLKLFFAALFLWSNTWAQKRRKKKGKYEKRQHLLCKFCISTVLKSLKPIHFLSRYVRRIPANTVVWGSCFNNFCDSVEGLPCQAMQILLKVE